MKSKLEIYALAVCFASMICIIISSAIASYSIISMIAPDITMNSYQYNEYQSNDAYWNIIKCCNSEGKNKPGIEEQELTKKRNDAYIIALSNEKHNGLQSLVSSLMFVFSGAIALFTHWIIAKRSRE
ncbi:hypothetical protein [Psychromonas hadalis]|uniref:hypothetical protein n=1 Tax=Psychromonas hadalis TaxID=211669 RepID=UPI0003B3FFF8|nr:hypothetical protein [Psychromonas hadalis]